MSAITCDNIYDYFVYKNVEKDEIDEGTDAFTLVQCHDAVGCDFEELHDKMTNEIQLSYDDFNAERSCMWVDEVKRRTKWAIGDTIYGSAREKHYSYCIWWSRDKTKIGYYTWILEADGYVSFSLCNGYTRAETANTKKINYIRPSCLYNDKNCDETN